MKFSQLNIMPDFIIPAINQEKAKFAFSKNSIMVDFRKPVPAYLNEKGNIIRLILFTALFALVFINIYAPFGADRWFDVNQLEFFTYSSLVILAGVLVVVISRIIMYYHGRKTFNKLLPVLCMDIWRNPPDGPFLCTFRDICP